MNAYSVAVDSRGFSADWVDILIVMAPTDVRALEVATAYIASNFPNRTVEAAEAYQLDGPARVVGRLLDTDEE